MKKLLLILALSFGTASVGFAQNDQPDLTKQEKIKALYVAYVTQQLALTPDEAQKFWPLHTQFENDLRNAGKNLSELDKQQAKLDIRKKYQDNFNKIIGANRCDRFFRMDGEFKRKLVDRMEKQGNQQRQIRQQKLRRGQ